MAPHPGSELLPPAPPIYFSRFVGRRRELTDLRTRVLGAAGGPLGTRLIGLVGLGGAGKTRLANELVRRLASAPRPQLADGVWWVDLAPVASATGLPGEIARAAGIGGLTAADPLSALVSLLRYRQAVLVLDNCEHLVGPVRTASTALLRSCPGLVVVATSRVPLGQGVEVDVQPLATAATSTGGPRSEAVELFYDRVETVLPNYPPGRDDEPAVTALCERFGGLPLAIELAAPWLRTVSATDLLSHVDRSLDLLTSVDPEMSPRHRTMRAVLDGTWSWLSDGERLVLSGLGAFVGGFSLEGAQVVAGATLADLAVLTERALIRRVPQEDDDTRYVMHELVRVYAADRLGELPAAAIRDLRRRHLEYLVTCTDRFEASRDRPDGGRWLARMLRDVPDVEAALSWAIEQRDGNAALRLLAGMKDVWNYEGSGERSRGVVATVLELPWDSDSPSVTAARATVLYLDGWPEFSLGHLDRCRELFLEALALYRQLDDDEHQSLCLRSLSRLPLEYGDHMAAERLGRQSLAISLRTGDLVGAAWALAHLSETAHARGDVATAERRLLTAIADFHTHAVRLGEGESLVILGGLYREQHRSAEALTAYERALELIRTSRITASTRNLMLGVAAVAVRAGRLEDAARLFGAAETWESVHGGWSSPICPPPADERAAARAGLGDATWDRHYGEGADLALTETVLDLPARVIERLRGDLAAPAPARLTHREVEVLALLAEGYSNDDLAMRLVVSPRTVHAHLRSIFRKLDVSSRTAALHEVRRLGMRL